MLTLTAMSERKWQRLPVLRRILEGETVPGEQRPTTSIDESMSGRIDALLGITALVLAHKSKLLADDCEFCALALGQKIRLTDITAVHHEIRLLKAELAGIAAHFSHLAGRIEELHYVIEGDRRER